MASLEILQVRHTISHHHHHHHHRYHHVDVNNCAGVVLGIRHDQHLSNVCETDEHLHHMHVHHMQRPPTANRPPFLVLGDSAYADRQMQPQPLPQICCAQCSHPLSSMYIRKALGGRGDDAAHLAAWRVAVEHEFKQIYVWFPSLKNKAKNRLFGRRALVQTYTCAALLVNMRTCIRDNQVANYFGVLAPTLQDFMTMEPAP